MREFTNPALALLLTVGFAVAAPSHLAALSPPSPLLQEQEEAAGDEEAPDTTTSYSDVITGDAITSEGLFDAHMIDGDLFYEIPLDMIDREMLLLTRVARTPDGVGYGGSKVNTSTVRWEHDGDRVRLRLVSYDNVADDTTAIVGAVRNSNFEPIIMAFDVEVMNEDSTALVVDVTDLFTEDITLLGLQKGRRQAYGVRRVDGDRTYVVRATAFPTNVEVRRVLTYDATDAPSNGQSNTLSMEMHHSMLLLPDDPMEPRLCDERVGYFSTSQIDYGIDEQRAVTRCLITRWRLEPSDPEAHARGELVDPVKPIVYYIDPATPPKWVPYLKQGVVDWQPAFEQAGFSNAIIAAQRDGGEVAATAAGTAEGEREVEQVVLRIHPSPEPPHAATADFDLVQLHGGQEVRRERWSAALRFEFLESVPPELVVHNPMGILITYLQADRALVTENGR